MIKGVGKQIVLLNNTESEIFEQAIFILKPGNKTPHQDIVKECERMMHHHIMANREPFQRNWWKIGFFFFLASTFILTLILYFK